VDNFTDAHESAHIVIGDRVGYTPWMVTTVAGTHLAGVTVSSRPRLPRPVLDGFDPCQPFCRWPVELRRSIEADVLYAMAGSVAELMLTGSLGRQEPMVAEAAAELVAAHPPTDEDRSWAAEVVDQPIKHNDTEQVARATWTAHGRDLASAQTWLEHMEAQCRALVEAHAEKIIRIGDVLAQNPLLGGEALAAMLRSE
jgi:hypothetical protein